MSDTPLAERLAAASEPVLREMLREAELHLVSQQTVALAADARAMTLTGFLAAAVVVLVGGAASFALATTPNVGLAVICVLCASGLLAAAGFAIWSASPSDFDFVGSSPADWVEDVEAKLSLEQSLAGQCQNQAEAIEDNHNRMAWNARRLWWAIRIAFGTIAVGGVAFVGALAG